MQATVKRRLTKVALALVVAGYCAAPAVAANGNLKSGQWQIVSEQTGTILSLNRRAPFRVRCRGLPVRRIKLRIPTKIT